ncbi:MAG: radical SAM family heme chaperone HemW [Oliverpabstia sp.]|nr:radical SAM family heme chaperone HemW [Oliverpabstia sp.]
MKKELELYIHIPFCVKKCEYCDFLSGSAGKQAQREYMEALFREIDGTEKFEDYEVSTIFIGGGTPSVLPGEWIEELMEKVKQHFSVRTDGEISIEANPGTVDESKLQSYRRAGINRISFGCQSGDDEELKMLGRIHTWEEFLESFSLARAAGFSNINVDLMSGLPGQSLSSWEESLEKVAKLQPEHVSAYSLIIEEGTPFALKKLNLPDEEEERKMYEKTHEILESYGYHQYEISNYGKPGKECLHNIGYWQRKEYLGLGLGSASLIQEKRFHNTGKMEGYLAKSDKVGEIREDIEKLTRENQMEEFMFLGLRMLEGVSEKEFQEKFGMDLKNIYGDVIKKYIQLGLLEQKGDRLYLTRRGISVSNPVLADFLLD